VRWVLAIVLLLQLGGGIYAGNRAYREGDYPRAVAEYRRAMARGDTSAALRYNLGTALLRTNQLKAGRDQLEAAAQGARRPRLAQAAHYNAGTSDLRGVWENRGAPDLRRQRLERAVQHYRRALRLDPSDGDARYNLELAQRLLDRMGSSPEPEQERSDDQSAGGGEEEQQAAPSPSQQPPQSRPSQNRGNRPRMSPEQAERVLMGAEGQERRTQREMLDRIRGSRTAERDW
jgi:tetratricopeptide (TPR) repeat protein